MGAQQRRKGHDWERAVARRLNEVLPGIGARRGLQARDGADAADVEIDIFHIECKRGKRTNPKAALKQAAAAAKRKKTPIAICKDDHEEATVTMTLDDFLAFLQEWWALRTQP